MDESVYEYFPWMKPFAKRLEGLSLVQLPQGAQIFEEGDPCQMIAFVCTGLVRVYKLSEMGREMTLYRINPGESCILSISSLLSHNPLGAIAVVEEPVTALAVPAKLFGSLMKEEGNLQEFVFDLLSLRLSEVLTTVEEVAFKRVDERIVKHLLQLPRKQDQLETTHQKIAVEVGTSREVVSRILKDLESQELLQLGRGTIQLKDTKKLQNRFSW